LLLIIEFQPILTLLLFKLFRFNLVAAFAAVFISNPTISPFLLLLSYKVGNASQIGYILVIGSAVTITLTALPVYFITKYTIEYKPR